MWKHSYRHVEEGISMEKGQLGAWISKLAYKRHKLPLYSEKSIDKVKGFTTNKECYYNQVWDFHIEYAVSEMMWWLKIKHYGAWMIQEGRGGENFKWSIYVEKMLDSYHYI